MRRRIDFEHVDVAAFGNLDARIANTTRIGSRPIDAVQRASEDSRRRRFSNATWSGKHERVSEPPARERVAQRTRHRRLPDDVVELLRPPLARYDLIGHLVAGCYLLVAGCW